MINIQCFIILNCGASGKLVFVLHYIDFQLFTCCQGYLVLAQL